MTAGAADEPLYGREDELQVVAGLVGGLAEGVGGALVVRGEAGIGKSALLAAAAGLAADSGARVLSATGIQAEARLPFAGLHQLLRPVLPLAERLPPRQRAGLLSAFGMADAEPAGPFLIGLAALELISDAAAGSPVLLIADDAQWLDEPSCAVLGFVARRLAAEPAALLVAIRDGVASPFDDAGLPELRLAGLIEPAATALLDARAPGLDPALRHRLLAEAAGNPLALVELPKAVRPGLPTPGGLPPSLLPLTARLERAFAAQEAGLPAATRAVLLAAAADDGGALPEVLAAASALTGTAVTADALLPAIAAGLAEIDETGLRFRHPLMRSAIYQTASVSQRRAAHAALAGLLDRHPDRRAWHRAAAVLGPDEQVAADLEAAAVRAERRGAVVMAVDAFRRAAQLSEDAPSRGRRLQRAATTAFGSGHPELGEDLLRAAESLDLAADQRTWVAYERETFTGGGTWSGATMVDSFVGLAERMRAAGHAGTALDALLSIAMRCYWGNPSERTRAAVIAAAEKLPLPDTDPALLLILASADPVRLGALVNARIEGISPDDTDPAGMFFAGVAAGTVWSWDRSLPLLEAGVNGLRRQGRLGLLVQALVTQAWAALHSSRIPAALSAADEAARLAPETGQGHWAHAARLVQALVTAAGGNADAADAMTQESESGYRAIGATPNLGLVLFARGRGAGRQPAVRRGARVPAADPRSGRPRPPSVRRHVGARGPGRGRGPRRATLTPRGPTWTNWSRWRRRRRARCCSRRRPTPGRWSPTAMTRSTSIRRPSRTGWQTGRTTGPGCCSATASGCAVSDGRPSPARRCGKPGIPSTPSASPASPSERGWSCVPPGNRAAAGNRGPGTS